MISIIVKILRFIGFDVHKTIKIEISKESWDKIRQVNLEKEDELNIFDSNILNLIIKIKK